MSNASKQLQEQLGSEFSVRGTRKLHVYGPDGTTAGTYSHDDQAVEGFAEVEFFGFEKADKQDLLDKGREAVEGQLAELSDLGFEVDFDQASVDSLGLSELTGGDGGPDFLYVVDIIKRVDSIEEAAAVLSDLAGDAFDFEIHE
ncbi:MAG: hypothetical protein ACQEVA_02990 [Myxococcota bacterium]